MLVLCFLAIAAFFVARKSQHLFPAPDNNHYFSGLLQQGPVSGCGILVKVMMDRFSCKLPTEICGEHNTHINQRIRIGALPEACAESSPIRCNPDMFFNDENFKPTHCYGQPDSVTEL